MNNELETRAAQMLVLKEKALQCYVIIGLIPFQLPARPFNQLSRKTNLQAFLFHPQRFTQQCGVSATMRNKVVLLR